MRWRVAQQSEHPQCVGSGFCNGAKHTADVVDKLADLHKKMNDSREGRTQTRWWCH